MAKAVKQPLGYEVVLTLSQEEAEFLRVVVGNCVGSINKSPRKHADSVYDALRGAGVELVNVPLRLGQDTIWFEDTE